MANSDFAAPCSLCGKKNALVLHGVDTGYPEWRSVLLVVDESRRYLASASICPECRKHTTIERLYEFFLVIPRRKP